MANPSRQRSIPFEACFNFRDLGGYRGIRDRPVRWGRLFRSMTPQYMTAADAERAQNLQIDLVIDLRGDRFESSGPLGENRRVPVGPRFLHTPGELPPEIVKFMGAPPQEALPRLLGVYGPAYAAAIEAMYAHPGATVLFHCRLGKDRTGVLSALLLKLLGVRDEDVIEDFMLTAQAEPAMRRLLNEYEAPRESREPRVAREPISLPAVEALLERLESQYATAYNYFLRNGVPGAHLDALIEGFLQQQGDGPPEGLHDSTWRLPALRAL